MTVVYVINRSPSSAIGFKTPEEKRSGYPPKLENLRDLIVQLMPIRGSRIQGH